MHYAQSKHKYIAKWNREIRSDSMMGKKACLALDLDYDGDEIYNDDYYDVDDICGVEDDDSGGKEAATDDAQPKQSKSPTNIKHKKSSPSNVCKSSLLTRDSTERRSISITPTSSLSAAATSTRDAHQIVHISNPHRQPLFTEHVATHDALLYHTVSYLDIKDVTRLSMVSNILNKSLSVDGLYCKNVSAMIDLGVMGYCYLAYGHKRIDYCHCYITIQMGETSVRVGSLGYLHMNVYHSPNHIIKLQVKDHHR